MGLRRTVFGGNGIVELPYLFNYNMNSLSNNQVIDDSIEGNDAQAFGRVSLLNRLQFEGLGSFYLSGGYIQTPVNHNNFFDTEFTIGFGIILDNGGKTEKETIISYGSGINFSVFTENFVSELKVIIRGAETVIRDIDTNDRIYTVISVKNNFAVADINYDGTVAKNIPLNIGSEPDEGGGYTLRIGQDGIGGNRFKGTIDAFRLVSKFLTEQERAYMVSDLGLY